MTYSFASSRDSKQAEGPSAMAASWKPQGDKQQTSRRPPA